MLSQVRERLQEMQPPVDRVQLMRAIDLNRNGTIDRRELGNGFKQLGKLSAEGGKGHGRSGGRAVAAGAPRGSLAWRLLWRPYSM